MIQHSNLLVTVEKGRREEKGQEEDGRGRNHTDRKVGMGLVMDTFRSY